MNQVYIHIGEELPSHSIVTINHNLKYSESPIYLLTNSQIPSNLDSKVIIINLNNFYSDKIKRLRSLNYFEGFWLYTFERLFILEEFIRQFKIKDALHIENDVLIYDTPQFLKYRKLYLNKIAMNPIGERYCTFAYAYVSLNPLSLLNDDLLFLLSLGQDELSRRLSGEMINEMTCIALLFKKKRKYLDFFPILPTGEFSKNYSELGYVYDSASYGQFLDGTPGTQGQPYRGSHHYIGRWLNDSDKIIFENGKPLLIKENYKVPIFDLHIHSKRIGLFTNF